MTSPKFFYMSADLRAWYEANHEGTAELLLGFHKVGSGPVQSHVPGGAGRGALLRLD